MSTCTTHTPNCVSTHILVHGLGMIPLRVRVQSLMYKPLPSSPVLFRLHKPSQTPHSLTTLSMLIGLSPLRTALSCQCNSCNAKHLEIMTTSRNAKHLEIIITTSRNHKYLEILTTSRKWVYNMTGKRQYMAKPTTTVVRSPTSMQIPTLSVINPLNVSYCALSNCWYSSKSAAG